MNYNPNSPITSVDTYEITGLTQGIQYSFEVYFASGTTGTVVPKTLSPDGVTYQTMTKDGADVSISETGTDRSGRYLMRGSGTVQFDVTAVSGTITISHNSIPHGR